MDIREFYSQHGIMTEIKTMKHMVANMPQDIREIISYVQNIFLHQHWAKAYGVILDAQKKKEPFLRSFEEKLVYLNRLGYRHVSDQKSLEEKMVAICRDFSVGAAALCREAGIPARARCGFATYFEEGKYIDHWVLEYWNKDENRWVMADAQLDDLQQKALHISFNTLDIKDEHFITGPQAWQMCRRGEYNPELFGIFQWWGYDYIKCNLILDANSLIKLPMQPWDGWTGYKNLPVEKWTKEDYAVMDELAKLALDVDNNWEALFTYIQHNDKIKVPDDFNQVINYLE